MSRPMLEVADILRDYGPAWRCANAGHVSLDQLKVTSICCNRTANPLGNCAVRSLLPQCSTRSPYRVDGPSSRRPRNLHRKRHRTRGLTVHVCDVNVPGDVADKRRP